MGLKSLWLNSSVASISRTVTTFLDTGEATGADEEPSTRIQVWGCRRTKLKSALAWIFTLLTLGILRLLFYWKPQWEAVATCEACALELAEIILIRNQDHQWFLRRVINVNSKSTTTKGAVSSTEAVLLSPNGEALRVSTYRYFTYRKLFYVWHPKFEGFHSLPMFDHRVSCQIYHQCSKGLSTDEATCRRSVYGANEIVVRLKPIVQLLFLETLNPFYVLQRFSVCVWFADEYYYYASVIVVMSLLSIVTEVYQTRKNQRSLRATIYSTDYVTVLRDEEVETLLSTVLVSVT